MSDANSLSAQIYSDLLPRISKHKYDKEWQKLLDFSSVTRQAVFAFEASLKNAGYSPPTLRTSVSILKKVTISKRIELPNETWTRLHSWIDNIGKTNVPRLSLIFTQDDNLTFLQQEDNRL